MTYFYRLVKHQFDDLRSVNEIARSKKLMSGYKHTTPRPYDLDVTNTYYTVSIHTYLKLINPYVVKLELELCKDGLVSR